MDDLPPPPPYTPRGPLTPTSSTGASPVPTSLHTGPTESGSTIGPSHDYYAYEQVSPATNPDSTELEEPLPSYDTGSSPRPPGTLNLRGGDCIHVREVEDGSHSPHNDRNINQPGFLFHSALSFAPLHPRTPHGVSIPPTSSTSSEFPAPSTLSTCARESMRSVPFGLSALQRVIDLAKQLSERPAEQGKIRPSYV